MSDVGFKCSECKPGGGKHGIKQKMVTETKALFSFLGCDGGDKDRSR